MIDKEEMKRSRQKELQQDKDHANRQKVISEIKKYIDKGMQQEQAVDYFISQNGRFIDENFSYLTRNGLSVRQCIINWTHRLKAKEKKLSTKNGEER